MPVRRLSELRTRLDAFGLQLKRDEIGAVAIFVALSLMILLGFVGLAVDVTDWYSQRRLTQNIADAAAIAATYADKDDGDLATVTEAALRGAKVAGYEDVPENQVTVAYSTATPSGAVTPRIVATVERQIPLFFSKAFLQTDAIVIAARAVGGFRGMGVVCVLALNKTERGALKFSGSTVADIGCGVASNSDNTEAALEIGGNATLVADPAQAVGNIRNHGSADIGDSALQPWQPEIPDPYGSKVFPAVGACDVTGELRTDDNTQLNCSASDKPCIGPSTGGSLNICGDLTIQRGLTLMPGTYYISGGDFSAGSQADIAGEGVTIILKESAGGDVGQVDINAQAAVALSAPESGPFEGIVFYQDRSATGGPGITGVNKFNGGSNLQLKGVIYFPKGDVQFAGGADSEGCTQIIADTVEFTGDSFIKNTPGLCDDIGIEASSGLVRQVILTQ